jgi:glycosyltransferase involved in cell wall biosynthesis
MHIAIVGPIATADIRCLLDGDTASLPVGYPGAPLLTTLIAELIKRGHRVTAVTMSGGMALDWRKPKSATGKDLEVFYVPMRRRAWRPNGLRFGRIVDLYGVERRALRHAIEQAAPDVVHAHWTYEFALAAMDTGLPCLVTCHDAPQVVLRYMPNGYRLLRYFMARSVLAKARHLTAVSPYLRDQVSQYARTPITIVPNPIGPAPEQHYREMREFDPARPRVAMVLNGWGKRKNPEPALRAFAQLRKNVPTAELVTMGFDYGPGQQAEQWARSRGIAEGIRFVGALPHATLMEELAKADLLIHPSLEETFGMTVAEAMSLGLPVIGGERSGAVPWIVGSAGKLVDVTKPAAIFEAAIQLLGDSIGFERLGKEAATQASERFNVDKVAVEYENAYRLTLERSRS